MIKVEINEYNYPVIMYDPSRLLQVILALSPLDCMNLSSGEYKAGEIGKNFIPYFDEEVTLNHRLWKNPVTDEVYFGQNRAKMLHMASLEIKDMSNVPLEPFNGTVVVSNAANG